MKGATVSLQGCAPTDLRWRAESIEKRSEVGDGGQAEFLGVIGELPLPLVVVDANESARRSMAGRR
jgi:hypothetical protein